MRFLLVGDSDCRPLSQRLVDSGGEVRYFSYHVPDDDPLKSQSWRPDMRWCNVVVHMGRIAGTGALPQVANDLGRLYWPLPDPLESGYLVLWNGFEYIGPRFKLTEWNRLGEGDRGPRVPRMGLLLEHTFDEVPILDANEPAGWVIVDGEQVGRPDAEVLYTLLAGYPLNLAPHMAGVMHGGFTAVPGEQGKPQAFSLGLRVYLPPWPWGEDVADIPTPPIADGAAKHVNVYHSRTGNLGWATSAGRGKTPREAKRRLKKVISGIDHDDLLYRADILE